MNISLRPEDQRFIQQQLSAGRFRSADEIIHAALTLLERQEEEQSNEPSCYDLLQQAGAIGLIKGGASDLSINPRHMEGFGET